jgi:hypothetical protein
MMSLLFYLAAMGKRIFVMQRFPQNLLNIKHRTAQIIRNVTQYPTYALKNALSGQNINYMYLQ